ncbi:polysaccharide biosynthesis/export family protein, partial [Phaeobacter italicus]|uniref:polysaccharide biosynthesis/export family protein n=1 Tax=Phaeobacter italicus TaxID=481446 RepID=UPI00248ED0CB
MNSTLRTGTALLALMSVAACTAINQPRNLEPVAVGNGYQAQYREPKRDIREQTFLRSEEINRLKCRPLIGGAEGNGSKFGGLASASLRGERLSRNDLIDIRVAEDDTFSGDYVVSRDGTLNLPYLRPIRAQGRLVRDVEADLATQLVKNGFYDAAPRISVRVADFASVTVGVSGAVFEPKAVEIGGIAGDQVDSRRQEALGASTEARNLSAALRATGGVRPDADISAIQLRRGSKVYTLDMRGVFEGQNAVDVMLLTGDEINVPSRGCFQDDLMRPSPISPPGVTLFLSNLTQPATGNAPSAIGREVREIPYGTRYMQAVIDTNCVGGTRTTNAHRSAALYTRNPMTGVSAVVERDIESMMRRADRDDYDPFLLPGDAIACYDSAVTNATGLGSA